MDLPFSFPFTCTRSTIWCSGCADLAALEPLDLSEEGVPWPLAWLPIEVLGFNISSPCCSCTGWQATHSLSVTPTVQSVSAMKTPAQAGTWAPGLPGSLQTASTADNDTPKQGSRFITRVK